ncbi:MAG: ABC transporter ATP-binding protein [Gemmatimonadetes bacterium]|nr:ABC transporter ATP-binding protein [Gemmatimonadota bacterium]
MLAVHQLEKTYAGNVAALRGISLDIPPGMFGLLGPNGAGKTPFMRVLAGLLEPSAGRVLFDGDDIVAHPDRLWPRLGYLPQYFGFYPNLTGTAMLRHMLRLKGVAHPRGLEVLCAELLERVNLSDAAGRAVKGYSGGMRQRLGIAQAIAGDPALLIVDEPTAGLDPEERTRFYRLLAELAETRTVLLSTHIVEDVAMLCPRFAVLCAGELRTNSTPGAATAALQGHIFEGEVAREHFDAVSDGYRVTRAYLVEGRNRMRIHAPDGRVPEGFTPAAPTLEDAYLLLTMDVRVTTAAGGG